MKNIGLGQVDPWVDPGGHLDVSGACGVVDQAHLELEAAFVHQRLDEHVLHSDRRSRHQEYILPDPDDEIAPKRTIGIGQRTIFARFVEKARFAHTDQDLVGLVESDRVGDIDLQRHEDVEIAPDLAAVHEHLTVAGNRLEAQEDPPAPPGFRNADRAPEPAHVSLFPRLRIARVGSEIAAVIDLVRNVPATKNPRAVAGAERIHVPRRRDLDRGFLPGVASRRGQRRVRLFCTCCHWLELPETIQADLLAKRLFNRRDPTFLRGKFAAELERGARRRGGGSRCGIGFAHRREKTQCAGVEVFPAKPIRRSQSADGLDHPAAVIRVNQINPSVGPESIDPQNRLIGIAHN